MSMYGKSLSVGQKVEGINCHKGKVGVIQEESPAVRGSVKLKWIGKRVSTVDKGNLKPYSAE